MNRRSFLTSAAAAGAAFALTPLLGCGSVSKATLAGLAQTIGNAVSNLANILGNTAIAAQIKLFTAQLVSDINGWTNGSPTADIILVITELEDAIALIPVTPQIAGLIELALGTIQAILAFFPGTNAAAQIQANTKAPRVHLAKAPKNEQSFKAAWNPLVPSNLSGALIP